MISVGLKMAGLARLPNPQSYEGIARYIMINGWSAYPNIGRPWLEVLVMLNTLCD